MWSAGNRELRRPRTRADGEARHGEQSGPFAARGRNRRSARLVGRRKSGRGTHGWLFWAARRRGAREECDSQLPRRLQDVPYALPKFVLSMNQATPPRSTGSGAPRAGLSLGARPARLRHPGLWRRCWSDWLVQAACGQSVGTCDEPMPAPVVRTAARPGPGLPDQLEGALDNGQQSKHGRRGQGRCRVTEHRDHHEGLAVAVGGQVPHG
jgi:hypothetical protein